MKKPNWKKREDVTFEQYNALPRKYYIDINYIGNNKSKTVAIDLPSMKAAEQWVWDNGYNKAIWIVAKMGVYELYHGVPADKKLSVLKK